MMKQVVRELFDMIGHHHIGVTDNLLHSMVIEMPY
jgi:hypothetical protein